MAETRRTFGPVVLAGLASGALVAVAGDRAWAAADDPGRSGTDAILGVVSGVGADDAARMPLATALALVVLACWGVVLVTRGRFRRVVAALALVAAVGALATAVVGWFSVPDALRDELVGTGVDHPGVHHTAWYWAALVGTLLASVAAWLAVRWVPTWPEMGSRYDAPAVGSSAAGEPPARSGAAEEPGEQSSLDLWKAIDEGRDPTA
jgi:uncharacterized membrane protein (TIGR02234 family)